MHYRLVNHIYFKYFIIKYYFMHLEYSPNFQQQAIAYIVPFAWWKNYFHNKTNSMTDIHHNIIADIDMTDIIDSMIIQFQDEYVKSLSDKSNGIQFRNRFISPPLQQNKRFQEDYYIITSQQWASLQIVKWKKIPVIIFGLKQYQPYPGETVQHFNGLYYVAGKKQFQIIMCTDRDSDIFIGYFPNNMNLIQAIRRILKEMKFVQIYQSKIIFVDYEKEVATSFSKHLYLKVKDIGAQQTFIMITNLIRIPQNEDQECRSDKAINGECNNKMVEQMPVFDGAVHHKTISTGASTPLTFSHDSERNDFQAMQMFREKTSQQIQLMKKHGNKTSEVQLIMVESERDENELKTDLVIISEQIIESLGYKKKNKEK